VREGKVCEKGRGTGIGFEERKLSILSCVERGLGRIVVDL
jgi:hypothetical protein